MASDRAPDLAPDLAPFECGTAPDGPSHQVPDCPSHQVPDCPSDQFPDCPSHQVGRLFEAVHTYDGKLDYKGYLDFVIAHEHRSHPAALAYFFRSLDLHASGKLGVFEINYFVRDIVQGLIDSGDEPPGLGTIVDEVFDLVKGRSHKSRGAGALERGRVVSGAMPTLSLTEFVHCGAGSIVMQMLIDVQGFWNWDNRESLIEYDDDDRYAKDELEAARRTTILFSHAAHRRSAPSIAALQGDSPEMSPLHEERRLRAARTITTLLLRVQRLDPTQRNPTPAVSQVCPLAPATSDDL